MLLVAGVTSFVPFETGPEMESELGTSVVSTVGTEDTISELDELKGCTGFGGTDTDSCFV